MELENLHEDAKLCGGIGALAPEGDLPWLGLKSMIAGLLACYLFAAVVRLI
jgi:hypothetical protein